MTEPMPLQPPAAAQPLVLTAPDPVQAVPATQAPKMAPKVDPAVAPALDQKVATYLNGLLEADTRSPEFAKRADDVRTMGDQDIRQAADSSNRLLATPVRALKEGGLADGSKVGQTLLELRRTVEDLDPSEASMGRKILGVIPFGDKIQDYFRRYESAQGQLNAIIQALYNGQDELRKDNAALNLEKQNLWDTMARLNQYIYVAERLDAQLSAKIAELQIADPDRAKALSRGRPVLRAPEAPGPAHPARGLDPGLPRDRHHHQEQRRAHQGRRPRDHHDGLRAAHRRHRGAGPREPEARARPDRRPEHHDVEHDRLDVQDARRPVRDHPGAGRAARPSGSRSCRQAFANIYATMDSISDFKVRALDSMSQTIGVLQTETTKASEYVERARRTNTDGVASGSLDLGNR